MRPLRKDPPVNKTNIAKRIANAAVGVGIVTSITNIINQKNVVKMQLPAKAAVITGAFLIGSILWDAAQTGINAQIDEIAAKVENRKK